MTGQDHNRTVRVLGIAGSLRKASYNRALIRAAQELASDGMEVETFDLDDIPLYNQDVEKQGFPESVQAMHKAISEADALLVSTPEYQHSVPGVLKNAIDWASRPTKGAPIEKKPVAIMGATPGRWGTARAQTQLRQTLVYNSCPMVLQPEILVSGASDRFDDEGNLVHEATRKFVGQLLEELLALVRRHSKSA